MSKKTKLKSMKFCSAERGEEVGVARNERLMIKICEMYYLLNLSQKEISIQLGISRPQISRILAQARENGCVEIRIRNPYSDESALEQRLMSAYALKDALVVRSMGDSREERMNQFSREAAVYFDSYLGVDQTIGIMSGVTVASIVRHMKNNGKRVKEAIPLVGGIGNECAELHANAIALKLAQQYGGVSCVMNAPLLVSSKEAAAMLRQEPSISTVLEKGRHCDICLVGIGNVESSSTTARAGGLTLEDLRHLKESGAVSSVCNSYFDADGQSVRVLESRCIGKSLEELRHGKVIACAIGQSKVNAIRSALKTGRLDVLMTDFDTATEILSKDPE